MTAHRRAKYSPTKEATLRTMWAAPRTPAKANNVVIQTWAWSVSLRIPKPIARTAMSVSNASTLPSDKMRIIEGGGIRTPYSAATGALT